MSKLEVEFKFEIGDIIFIRCAQHMIGTRPLTFIITERLAQQCSGGVQCQYMIQGPKGPEGPYMEIALSKEEPAYRAMTQAGLDDISAQRIAGMRPWSEIGNDMISRETDKKKS